MMSMEDIEEVEVQPEPSEIESAKMCQTRQKRRKLASSQEKVYEALSAAHSMVYADRQAQHPLPTAKAVKLALQRVGRAHYNKRLDSACRGWVTERTGNASTLVLVDRARRDMLDLIQSAVMQMSDSLAHHGQWIKAFDSQDFLESASMWMVHTASHVLLHLLAGSCPFLTDNPDLVTVIAPYIGSTAWSATTPEHFFGHLTLLLVQTSTSLSDEDCKPRVRDMSMADYSEPAGQPRYIDLWTAPGETHCNRACTTTAHYATLCECHLLIISIPQADDYTTIRLCHRFFSPRRTKNVFQVLEEMYEAAPDIWTSCMPPKSHLYLSNCSTPLGDMLHLPGLTQDMFTIAETRMVLKALVQDTPSYDYFMEDAIPFRVCDREVMHRVHALSGCMLDAADSYNHVKDSIDKCLQITHQGQPVVQKVHVISSASFDISESGVYPNIPHFEELRVSPMTLCHLMHCYSLQDVTVKYIFEYRHNCMQYMCKQCSAMHPLEFMTTEMVLPQWALFKSEPQWVCSHFEGYSYTNYSDRLDRCREINTDREMRSMRQEDIRSMEMKALDRVSWTRAQGTEDFDGFTLTEFKKYLKIKYNYSYIAAIDAALLVGRDQRQLLNGIITEPRFIPLFRRTPTGRVKWNNHVYSEEIRLKLNL